MNEPINHEAFRKIVAILKEDGLTVAEVRAILREIDRSIEYHAVIK